ncbi:MAG: flagellar basal body rod C-terminal domain-containing protein [Bryobacteraceae bacterium]
MSDFAVSLGGLNQAQSSINGVANRVARAPVAGGSNTDNVDLSAEAVALLQARNDFSANLNAIKAVDQLQKSAINLLG